MKTLLLLYIYIYIYTHTHTHIYSKVTLKILQARLQQYVSQELPDVQAGFRKGRGTRDQIANICWIIEKATEFQKNIYFCFTDYAIAFDCMNHNKLENSSRDGNTRPLYLPPGFPCGLAGKESACNAGDLGLIPGLGRSPGEGKGYSLQYSGLENSMDCIIHGVAKSRT